MTAAALWAATTPSPSSTSTSTPSPSPTLPDPDSVTPGVAGFLVVFVLAVATWLLLRNMTARLRRMRFREEQRAAAEAADAADSAGAAEQPGGPDDGTGDAQTPPTGR